MLADDLIADRGLAKILGPGHQRLVQDLRKAHRFDLERGFAAAADELGTSRPSAFAAALPLCRPPYDPTWIETSQAYRARFTEVDPARPAIKRVGLLLQPVEGEYEHRRWAAVLAWSFPSGEVNLSTIGWLFDVSKGQGPYFPEIGGTPGQTAAEVAYRATDAKLPWSSSPREITAAAAMGRRGMEVVSLYHAPVMARLEAEGRHEVAARLQRTGQEDWNGEHVFALGVLALLNSRNAVETEAGPDLTRLNKARRRSGKAELLTFRTCRIAPRLASRIAAERAGPTDEAGVRAHFVRGHFKVRKSGIFWWSPFLRGDARQGLVMKDYRVTT